MEAKEGVTYGDEGLINRNSFRNIEEERLKMEREFQNNEEFRKNKNTSLDCQVYLYSEPSKSAHSREALVFHFKHLFDITIEGVPIDRKNIITNVERIGLPTGPGQYFNLTPTFIRCTPSDVINKGSKGNRLNYTGMINPRDWIYQALASLGFDNLVRNITQHKYESSYPPRLEPKPSLCDSMRNKAAGFFFDAMDTLEEATKPQKKGSKKVLVQIPKINVPHVPSEYDEKERNAVVIRYNKDKNWGVLFHFEGDDSFRTVQGVWDENILKPSFKKERPNDGNFMEIGRIQISPKRVRDLTLDNVYNGAQSDCGVCEIDWAKQIADRVGLLSHWNSGEQWQYLHPPQYTVGPDRTIFMLPSSRSSVSK